MTNTWYRSCYLIKRTHLLVSKHPWIILLVSSRLQRSEGIKKSLFSNRSRIYTRKHPAMQTEVSAWSLRYIKIYLKWWDDRNWWGKRLLFNKVDSHRPGAPYGEQRIKINHMKSSKKEQIWRVRGINGGIKENQAQQHWSYYEKQD